MTLSKPSVCPIGSESWSVPNESTVSAKSKFDIAKKLPLAEYISGGGKLTIGLNVHDYFPVLFGYEAATVGYTAFIEDRTSKYTHLQIASVCVIQDVIFQARPLRPSLIQKRVLRTTVCVVKCVFLRLQSFVIFAPNRVKPAYLVAPIKVISTI